MHRFAVLAVVAACATSAPSHPTARPAPASIRYTLQPIQLFGGEGRHSSSQSSTMVTGALELVGDEATLTLGYDTFHTYVYCPTEMAGTTTMQACADDHAKPYSTSNTGTLRGPVVRSGKQLEMRVRAKADSVALVCDESFVGLTCAVQEGERVIVGDHLTHMVFATAGAKRYAIAPRVLDDGSALAGTIEMIAGEVTVALVLDGGAPIILPGRVFWAPAGLIVDAQTSPTRTFNLACHDAPRGLACEVTADRSVLGKPDHIYGQLSLVQGG